MKKILSLDIETRPALAYTWKAYDVNINHDQIVEPGGIICFAAKWVGKPGVMFYSEWSHTRKEMLEAARALLEEADAVLTFNGENFDLPKLNGEFLLAGLDPAPPVTSIDVYKAIKKLGYIVNKLAFIGPLLGVGSKMKHEGFGLWLSVMQGDLRAMEKMRKYNIQDVVLLEKLYKRVLPFIAKHPHLGDEKGACGACGSNHVQSRGWRRTKFFKVQRIQCQNCGSWQEGSRVKVA